MSKWPLVKLGEVLHPSEDWVTIDPSVKYREVTVRLWGKGVVERGEVFGSKIAASTRLRVHTGEFIFSRIDARNGALGIVPEHLDGAVVSGDFPAYTANPGRLLPSFLGWLCRMPAFVDMCRLASEGTTNRVRIKEDRLMASQIPLPPIEEQQRIVAKVDAIAAKVAEASSLRATSESDLRQLLLAAYRSVSRNATSRRLAEVAPLVRRPVPLDRSLSYLELGVRSFGRGTFHKPPLSGSEIGTKKLFRIEPGDLVFNIVFAWEGAVAVARPEDRGRFGSHRFLTCVPRSGIASASYLCFHFLTDDGLAALGAASPGGAGRNRTLGLQALANLSVPLPDYQQQLWFDDLLSKATAIRTAAHESNTRLAAILPSVVDRAFRGEL